MTELNKKSEETPCKKRENRFTGFLKTYSVPLLLFFGSIPVFWLAAEHPCGPEYFTKCTWNNISVWQTSIAAVIGFSSLIAAAIHNSKLTHARDVELRNYWNNVKAKSFLGEIHAINHQISQRCQYIRPLIDAAEKAEDTNIISSLGRIELTASYNAHAQGLGEMPATVAITVIEFYGLLGVANDLIAISEEERNSIGQDQVPDAPNSVQQTARRLLDTFDRILVLGEKVCDDIAEVFDLKSQLSNLRQNEVDKTT